MSSTSRDLDVNEVDRNVAGRRALTAEPVVGRRDGNQHLRVERAESAAALALQQTDHPVPSPVYTNVLAHGITVLKELLGHDGTERYDLVPVVDVREPDEHPAREIEIPGRQVLWSDADHLGESVLPPRGERREAAYLRRGGEHRRRIYGIDKRVGVAERELPVSLRLNEQEVRSQPLDDPGDLLRRAPTDGHERDNRRHADDYAEKREAGAELVGPEGG